MDNAHLILPVLFGLCIAAFVGGIFWFSVQQQKRADQNLAALAQRLGLAMGPPRKSRFARHVPSAQGTVRGRAVRLYSYTTGSGKNTMTWCAVAVTVPNPGRFSLRISRENLLTRAGRVFGVDDVATGDPVFDEKFYVKSNDPGYVRAALIPEIRTSLTRVCEKGPHGNFAIEGSDLRYAEVGTFASPRVCERVPALLDVALDLAELVEARRG